MNKKELKRLMKPIVVECIKEALFEEGILSGIISEVIKGTGGVILEKEEKRITKPTPTLESKQEAMERMQQRKASMNAQKKQLLDSIGKDAYNGVNLFEGTDPLSRGGSTKETSVQVQGPLSSYAPDDAGVDISGLLNISGGSWKKIK